ncbi:hypothetical protein JXM83_05855 [Candidatus Woesearchaeota archaeon]|nr:hypothetical protein [Candidatus Woesearchaeota archaeon]
MYNLKENKTFTKQFHEKRRMFAIKDNKLYWGRKNTTNSHAQWFDKKGWDIKEILRGYIDDTGIYFYRGLNFTIKKTDIEIIKQFLNKMQTKLTLKNNTKIYGGMIKQKSESKWPPKIYYGTIKDQ